MSKRVRIFCYPYNEISSSQITRKLGHRCASLTCITWISCISCIIAWITCTREVSLQLISWDIIDIAGILVPQNISQTYFVRYHWLSLNMIEYYWILLNIIEYHWILFNIIEYHWLSMIIVDYHWFSLIIFE